MGTHYGGTTSPSHNPSKFESRPESFERYETVRDIYNSIQTSQFQALPRSVVSLGRPSP